MSADGPYLVVYEVPGNLKKEFFDTHGEAVRFIMEDIDNARAMLVTAETFGCKMDSSACPSAQLSVEEFT